MLAPQLFFALCAVVLIGALAEFCTTSSCMNSGTCVEMKTMYTCQCPKKFFGRRCEYFEDCFTASKRCVQGTCSVYYSMANGDLADYNVTCSCYTGYYGELCEYEQDMCDSSPCTAGECVSYANNYMCICKDGYSGTSCDTPSDTDYCATNSCQAGLCMNASTSYYCKCGESGVYPRAYGRYCSDPGINQYCTSDICLYGSCSLSWNYNSSGVYYASPYCSCLGGFAGKMCDTSINYCETYTPCQNNGTCESSYGTYTCTCPEGYTGSLCQSLASSTVSTTSTTSTTSTSTSVSTTSTSTSAATEAATIQSTTTVCVGPPCSCYKVSYAGQLRSGEVCSLRDAAAKCIDGNTTFTCSCSANFTGQYCDMAASLDVMLGELYGDLSPAEIATVREDLQAHPPKLQDLIPFITGPMAAEARTQLSWDFDEFFLDAAFELRALDVRSAFVRWNDVVLGNCFTFNHANASTQFRTRDDGRRGGLFVHLQVHSDDYPYWVDTSAITVFFHRNGEAVFAESSRTQARSAAFTTFYIRQTDFHRLGGRYGKCAKTTSDVKSYYYEGIYTIDVGHSASQRGCFRSCYQDLLKENCKCMDPRYPFPMDETSCGIPQRKCLEAINAKYGDDPSQLPGCECPQPCSYSQFDVSWSLAPLPKHLPECALQANVSECEGTARDTAKIEVNFASFSRLIYSETPSMTFNAFLGYLGGILGILCGVSIVTFIEFGYLVMLLGSALCGSGKRRR